MNSRYVGYWQAADIFTDLAPPAVGGNLPHLAATGFFVKLAASGDIEILGIPYGEAVHRVVPQIQWAGLVIDPIAAEQMTEPNEAPPDPETAEYSEAYARPTDTLCGRRAMERGTWRNLRFDESALRAAIAATFANETPGYSSPWTSLTVALEQVAAGVGKAHAWEKIKAAIIDGALRARGLLDGQPGAIQGEWLRALCWAEPDGDCLWFDRDKCGRMAILPSGRAERIEVDGEQVARLWPNGESNGDAAIFQDHAWVTERQQRRSAQRADADMPVRSRQSFSFGEIVGELRIAGWQSDLAYEKLLEAALNGSFSPIIWMGDGDEVSYDQNSLRVAISFYQGFYDVADKCEHKTKEEYLAFISCLHVTREGVRQWFEKRALSLPVEWFPDAVPSPAPADHTPAERRPIDGNESEEPAARDAAPNSRLRRPSEDELREIIRGCFPANKMPGISAAEAEVRMAIRGANFLGSSTPQVDLKMSPSGAAIR